MVSRGSGRTGSSAAFGWALSISGRSALGRFPSGAGGAATRPQTANPTFSKSASSSLGELNKDNIKILADKRINGIVVMARKADMRAVVAEFLR